VQLDPDIRYAWRAYAGYLIWLAVMYLAVTALTIAGRGNPERLLELGLASADQVQARLFSRVAFFVYPIGGALFAFAGAFLITLDRHFELQELTGWAPRRFDAVFVSRSLFLVAFILVLPFVALIAVNARYLEVPVAIIWFDLVLAYLFATSVGAFFCLGVPNDLAALAVIATVFLALGISMNSAVRDPPSLAFLNPLLLMFHPDWVSGGVFAVPGMWRPVFAFHWLFLASAVLLLSWSLFRQLRPSQ
jgi:hypothetical protein